MADEMPNQRRLPRSMRLQNRREFVLLKDRGHRLVRGCLILNWAQRTDQSASRLGVVTTRKLGKANIRVRARRLMREAFRLHQHDLKKPLDIILVARSSIKGKKLAEVERDFLLLLRQAKVLKEAE